MNPTHLEIINESYMHNVPKGSETHFKVVVISDVFDKLPLIKVSFNHYNNYYLSYLKIFPYNRGIEWLMKF